MTLDDTKAQLVTALTSHFGVPNKEYVKVAVDAFCTAVCTEAVIQTLEILGAVLPPTVKAMREKVQGVDPDHVMAVKVPT